MPHNRFYIDAPLITQERVLLEGEEAHHLVRVMRGRVGERVELVNGKNQLGIATIATVQKKVELLITQVTETPAPLFKVILCQGLCRSNRLDTIIEKGTELGMHELWIFPGELSEKKEMSSNQIKRNEGIAISAMKQSGRLDLPKISFAPPLLKWESLDYPSYFGDTSPQAPLFLSQLQTEKPEKGVLFFVGPESGFSKEEERHLTILGAHGVKLHPHILRTDTAPLVALSLLYQTLS